MRKILSTFLAVAVLVSTASCIKEQSAPIGAPASDGEARVILRLSAPGSFLTPGSRALTHAQENTIDDIYVLVFDRTNTLVSIMQGEDITGSPASGDPAYSGTGSFAVTLDASRTTADTYNLMVLANAARILGKPGGLGFDVSAVGDRSYAGVAAGIWDVIVGSMYPSGGAIPMWGESGHLVVAPGNNNHTIKMIRSVARIDAGVGNPSCDSDTHGYSWDGNDTYNAAIPFALDHVYIIAPNDRYAVVPDADALGAGNPTLPEGAAAFTLAASKHAFSFASRDGCVTQSIYVPEADILISPTGKPGDANHTRRMAVVVGGRYDGSPTETFYRLDFARGGELMNVLRNHLYRFSISSVSGAGYPDVETAYESLAMNMTVDILEWDDAWIDSIVFDEQYYLGVNPGEFRFTREGAAWNDGGNVLRVTTDHPSGWSVESIKDTETGAAADWLETDAMSGGRNTVANVRLRVLPNNGYVPRSAEIVLAAGRLRYTVTVTQSIAHVLSLTVADGVTGPPITELLFISAGGEAPESKRFSVSWLPKTAGLTISHSAVPGTGQFILSDCVTPELEDISGGSDGAGTMTYTVSPAAFDGQEPGYPFVEKAARVDFMVSNGIDHMVKSLFFRHINCALVTDAKILYLLTGETYTFNVKSNTAWAVLNVEDMSGVLDPEVSLYNQGGGYNTAPGGVFRFKLINDTTGEKDGATVTITFYDPTGRMGTTDVTFKAASCGVGGEAVKRRIGKNLYDTHAYNGRCWMVQNSREGVGSSRMYGYDWGGNEIGGLDGNTQRGGANGYYYSWVQATTAIEADKPCPAGWRLPTAGEVDSLKALVNADSNLLKCWTGNAQNNSVFTGYYMLGNPGKWYDRGSRNFWWSDKEELFFYGNKNTMEIHSGSDAYAYWFSVRCVEE